MPPADKFPGGVLPEGVGEETLVIDPATSRVTTMTSYQGTTDIVLAEWTDQLPPVVPPVESGDGPPTAEAQQ